MFFYMLNGSPFGFLSVGLFGNGSAAAPSISFQNGQTDGIFWISSGRWGLSGGGSERMRINSTDNRVLFFSTIDTQGNTINIGATTPATITGDNGAFTITAAGTNKNITLTPSGTGYSLFSTSTAAGRFFGTTFATFNAANATQFSFYGHDPADGSAYAGATASGVVFRLFANGAESARLVGTHLLLGGLTTDGTGVLQFPAATTSAGGITFGTDVNFFRQGAGTMYLGGNGTMQLFLNSSGGNGCYWSFDNTTIYFGSNGANAITFKTNGNAALTLDTSQNATFAALAICKLYTVATLPAAAAGNKGARAHVSDANATTFASIVAGGGANIVPVYSDGTNWRIG